jgi:hypothetical protein
MKKIQGTKVEFCNADTVTVFFANELSIDADGWAMIAPLGDFPSEALFPMPDGRLKKGKAIQRISKERAEEMVAQFHNSRSGLKKFIRGCNIYLGHPDAPGMEKRYPDKTSKGVFADMEIRDKGIYGLPVFTNEGVDLVEGRTLVNGKKVRGFSARFVESVPDGDKNGLPVYCPTQIASAGLTPYPHLPVEFFNSDDTLADANAEAEKQQQKQNMKKRIIAVMGLLGIQFANAADVDDDAKLESALGQVETKVAAFANESANAATATKTIKSKLMGLCTALGIQFANAEQITDPAATIDQANSKVTSLVSERDSARTEFTNERAGRINDELASAIRHGLITDAEKATWHGRLNVPAQFANELTAIRALTPKVKTTSFTLERGQRRDQIDLSNASQRRQFCNEVCAEIAAEQKLDPLKHSKQIQNLARSRHPQLFEAPHIEIKR